jgi:hypothetical protein
MPSGNWRFIRVQRDQPVPDAGLKAGVVADHLLGVPVEHDDQMHPAEGPSIMTLAMSMLHSLGRVGFSFLVSALRRARSLRSGFTREVGRLPDAVDAL